MVAIETPFSVADFEREQRLADAALREVGIESYSFVHPYGFSGNWADTNAENFVTTDGHVLISVEKDDVSLAETVLAPLALQTIYVRERIYEEIVLTSAP